MSSGSNFARAAVELTYSVANIWEGIPYVLYTFLVFGGGLLLWNLFFFCLERVLLARERASKWVLERQQENGRRLWVPRPSWTDGSRTHFVLQSIFYAGILLIVWVTGASAGFNPWTTSTVMLGLTLGGAYVFGQPLALLSAGYICTMRNTIAVGQYWEFLGMPGYDGRIIAIYTMEVELDHYDEQTRSGMLIHMPIDRFLSVPRRRNWAKEKFAKATVRSPNDLFPDSTVPLSSSDSVKYV